jgi:hypothetical protein
MRNAATIAAALLTLLLAAGVAALRAGETHVIAFRATPFSADEVRVEAVGAVGEDVRWVAVLEPSTRWDAGRGLVAHLEVMRDVPMRVVGVVRAHPGGRVLGRIGGRFVYDGSVRMLVAEGTK